MTGFGIRVWLVCLLLASAEPALAQPTSVEWRAPAACPDQAALMAEIERLLGTPALSSARFSAVAAVSGSAERGFALELHFSTDEGSGTRHFQAQDCSDILRLAAFSIALAIDPTLGTRSTPPPPQHPAANLPALPPLGTTSSSSAAPSATPSAVVTPAPTTAAPTPAIPAPRVAAAATPTELQPSLSDSPSASPSSSVRDGLWLGAELLGDSALMPNTSGAVSLWGHKSWRHQSLRVGLAGTWFFPQSEALATGAGGDFSLWLVELRGCYGQGSQLQAALCPTIASGVETGHGIGVDDSRTQRSWFFAPGLAAMGLVHPSERVIASFEAQALFPLPRDEFLVSDERIHSMPAVSLQIGVGVGVLAY